jgi:hypothetical protein
VRKRYVEKHHVEKRPMKQQRVKIHLVRKRVRPRVA